MYDGLLQLHWWSFEHPAYLDAMEGLARAREAGRVATIEQGRDHHGRPERRLARRGFEQRALSRVLEGDRGGAQALQILTGLFGPVPVNLQRYLQPGHGGDGHRAQSPRRFSR